MVRFLIPLPLILLTGCAVGPDYRPPAKVKAAAQWTEPATAGAVDGLWWRQFGDATLTGLIERGTANSPTLAEATARIAEARANREAVAGAQLPQAGVSGAATENRLSENGQIPVGNIPGFTRDFGLFDVGFDASWEIDLWGRGRRQVEAADARAEAAVAGRQDVLVALQAEIARAYIDLRAAQARADNARASAAADAVLASLMRQRFEAGESSRLDLETADAAARASAALIPAEDAQAAAATYRIAALIGVPPEAIAQQLRSPAPLPAGPDAILAGVRSDLLTRRPDIRRAERELAAATADVGVATADLFPRFSLIGGIGQQARSTDDLLSASSMRFQVGPSLHWPVFSGGTVRAQLRAADARAQGAAARYEGAVMNALADSETAVARFVNARMAAGESGAALEREQAAFALARQRMESGEDDRLTLERARKSLLASQARELAARARQSEAAIALFKALGGGWQID